MLRRSNRMPLSSQRLQMGEDTHEHRLSDDLSADPLVGKDLQQNGMGHAAIDDVRFSDTVG